jgi:hypothetical protein
MIDFRKNKLATSRKSESDASEQYIRRSAAQLIVSVVSAGAG